MARLRQAAPVFSPLLILLATGPSVPSRYNPDGTVAMALRA